MIEGMMEITDGEFTLFRDLIYHNFGINLTEAKRMLLVRRLQNLLRSSGFASFSEYYDYLVSHPSDTGFSELVNRITTNYTFFNREPDHFTLFRQTTLPWIEQRHTALGSHDLRVWCAAASTGEEPYMLAMLMLDYFGLRYSSWDAGILATDISQKALAIAATGRYPADEFDRLPATLRDKYFRSSEGGTYTAVPRLVSEITYRRFNLVNRHYPFKKPFDAIFCRNVMIYFDNPTKQHVIDRLHQSLVPGGYLFIGHSESIINRGGYWQYVQPAVYRKLA